MGLLQTMCAKRQLKKDPNSQVHTNICVSVNPTDPCFNAYLSICIAIFGQAFFKSDSCHV